VLINNTAGSCDAVLPFSTSCNLACLPSYAPVAPATSSSYACSSSGVQSLTSTCQSCDAGTYWQWGFSDSATLSAQLLPLSTSGFSGDTEVGGAVSLSGDGSWLAAGARQAYSGVGAVLMYQRSGSSYILTQVLQGIYSGSMFGNSVLLSFDGLSLLVGEPGRPNGGGLWLHTRASGASSSWISAQEITIYGTDCMGCGTPAWSTDTNIMVVGNRDEANGVVYVFTRSGNSYSQAQRLQAVNWNGYDYYSIVFGMTVALSGNGRLLAASAERQDNSQGALPPRPAAAAGALRPSLSSRS